MDLLTPSLRIREFTENDFEALREMDSHPELHTYERELPSQLETRQALDTYIKEQVETPRIQYRFAVTILPQNTVRGMVKLARQWETIREWEVGWAIHPSEWNKGYATEAAWHLIDWGFRELNIHRVVAFCHASNAASVRVMEKLGMHQDGRLRETRWLKDEWWDEYLYAILDKEWKGIKDLCGM